MEILNMDPDQTEEFDNVSSNCMHFLKRLLNKIPENRLGLDQALKDSWFKEEKETDKDSLKNFEFLKKKFLKNIKLQKNKS